MAGGKAGAVAAGAARARGGGARGQQQRGPPRRAQARAEAAAAALPAAVPRRGRPAPREERGTSPRDGGQLGEALLRRRAAGGRAGALQQEAGAYAYYYGCHASALYTGPVIICGLINEKIALFFSVSVNTR